MTKWQIYVDGACRNNGKMNAFGGIGAILMQLEGKTIKTGLAVLEAFWKGEITNNRMEILAAFKALEVLERGEKAVIYSDSEYLVNTINRGWARKKNNDLWFALDTEIKRVNVEFKWVRGHGRSLWNLCADRLAVAAADNKSPYVRRQITHNEYMSDEEFSRVIGDIIWGKNKAVVEKSLILWQRLSDATREAIEFAAQSPEGLIFEDRLRDGLTWFVADEFFFPAKKTEAGWFYRLSDKGTDLHAWVKAYRDNYERL